MLVRRHYIFTGRVQGVGFRFTMYQKALNLGMTGWVRNRYDGSVEAILQGKPQSIEQLLAHMQSIVYIRIDHMEVENLNVLENERSFEMKY